MRLPFDPPLEPMLAKPSDGLPEDEGWLFEPKWDGFRAIVFRDGDETLIQSRDLKPLDRYFPELAAPLRRAAARSAASWTARWSSPVRDGHLDFDALLLRIHPAESRVRMLAAESPASFVAWDLLALGDEDLRGRPPGRAARPSRDGAGSRPLPPVHLTPATLDRALAERLVPPVRGRRARRGHRQAARRARTSRASGRCSRSSTSGRRTAWSPGSAGTRTVRGRSIGSLLLGLFDDAGKLHHVGITASFTMARRAELVAELAPLRMETLEGHPWAEWGEWAEAAAAAGQRVPGNTSRWNRGRDLSWEPLRPERVVEVAYDHLQGTRFRHGTTFVRWRPDRRPEDCRYDQLEETAAYELSAIFGS